MLEISETLCFPIPPSLNKEESIPVSAEGWGENELIRVITMYFANIKLSWQCSLSLRNLAHFLPSCGYECRKLIKVESLVALINGHAIWILAPKSWAEDYTLFSGDISKTDCREGGSGVTSALCFCFSMSLHCWPSPMAGPEQNSGVTNKWAPLCQALGSFLLYTFSHLSPQTPLRIWYYYYCQSCTDRKTEVRRG